MNRIEVHPFGQRKDPIVLCEKHNIKIVVNWSAAHGNVVLPKLLTASRTQSDFDSFDFELSDKDMATSDSLEENYVTGSLHKSED